MRVGSIALQNIMTKVMGVKVHLPLVLRLRKEALIVLIVLLLVILAVAVWIFDQRAMPTPSVLENLDSNVSYHPEENWYRAQAPTTMVPPATLSQDARTLYPGSGEFEDDNVPSNQTEQTQKVREEFLPPEPSVKPQDQSFSSAHFSSHASSAVMPSFPSVSEPVAENNVASEAQVSLQSDLVPVQIPKQTNTQTLSLTAGTIIPAVLLSGINSDLPGMAIAQVRLPVYDSSRGQHILIPQGSRLLMSYNSQIAFGQRRVFLNAQRIIFPDGRTLVMHEMPLSDLSGQSGFRDHNNSHYQQIFGSAIALSVISAGLQVGQTPRSSILAAPSTGQIARGSVTETLGDVASQTIEKNLNIQPTLSIRPGYLFNLILNQDVVVT